MNLTIHCEDCGRPYVTKRANTKVCSFHRFQRDLIYARAKKSTSECAFCEKPFARLQSQTRMCGQCVPPPKSNGEAVCAMCGKLATKVHKEVGLCIKCAQDPAKEADLFDRVKQKDKFLRTPDNVLETK